MFAHRSLRALSHGGNAIAEVRHPSPRPRSFAGIIAFALTLGSALSALGTPAHAHGIAGNRLFPGTLAFDDPAVMDEFALTGLSLKHPADGAPAVVDAAASWELLRLITPTIGLGVGSGFIHRDWMETQRSGFDQTNLMLKTLVYENDPHEVMLSAGLSWGISGSAAKGVSASQFNTLQPAVFFGKGFGDAPSGLTWLRPFAVTGAVSQEIPLSRSATGVAFDPAIAQL